MKTIQEELGGVSQEEEMDEMSVKAKTKKWDETTQKHFEKELSKMRRMNPREARRMMQRMGMNMGAMPDVEQVIFKTSSKEIIVENPEVTVMEMQGQKIFQVMGDRITEKAVEKEVKIPEEDVQLVATQANVSSDQARAALEQTKGDLAQAILLLSQTK
jgi:nascent polypeptide-associated complex subunit alpha